MSFHIPDLNALEAMTDLEIRFHAIVGVLVSLTSAMERLEFTTFQKGSRMDTDLAAAIFFKVRNDGARTSMARAAMDHRMGTDQIWRTLARRLDDNDAVSSRNLVSHNPATREVRPTFQGLLALTNHVPEGIVQQDPVQVRLGNKKDTRADFLTLRKACEHLYPLYNDLKAFLDALP